MRKKNQEISVVFWGGAHGFKSTDLGGKSGLSMKSAREGTVLLLRPPNVSSGTLRYHPPKGGVIEVSSPDGIP